MLLASTMVIYFIRSSPPLLFYVWGILSALLIPLPVMAVCYIVLIPLLNWLKVLRNRQTVIIIAGFLGIALNIGFNLYFQTVMRKVADPQWVVSNFTGGNSLILRLGRAYPPAILIVRAMSEPVSFAALFSMVALFAVCFALPALLFLLLSGTYIKSLSYFNENHVQKLKAGQRSAFMEKYIKKRPVFLSLVKREIVSMNREPMYLLNGPFIIILLPVIVAVALFAQKGNIKSGPGPALLLNQFGRGSGLLIAGLCGAFLGSSTSISCTALSRDAKALHFIKSLPISASAYMLAKIAHATVFSVIGSLTGSIAAAFVLKLSAAHLALSVFIALCMSSL